ncbi:MAG: flagellar export chaperone FliS [Treponema sp.]|jgi:flagellar protein FliS|nr:flagellar export chaperone FliS [Treponema sp.]
MEGKALAYNALSSYKNTDITTASPAQLLVKLYDEAVHQLDKSIDLLDEYGGGEKTDPGKIEPISKAVIKTQNIITELMTSLDMEQGGEIATNLFALYSWFNKELFEANINHDKRRITIVRNMVSELRNTWNEVASNTAVGEKGTAPRNGVNISF